MDRGASSTFLTELGKDSLHTALLIEAEFAGGAARATDFARTIEWDGKEFIAAGHVLGISPVSEAADLEITTVTVSLSGVDQAYIATVLGEDYIDRPLRIWRALFTRFLQLVDEPLLIFDGLMDRPVIEDEPPGESDRAGTSTVTVTANAEFGDITGTNGRRTSDLEQRKLYPGDKGFEFVSQLNRSLIWGRK